MIYGEDEDEDNQFLSGCYLCEGREGKRRDRRDSERGFLFGIGGRGDGMTGGVI